MKQETSQRRVLFVSLGLSEKEALLYDFLLENGEVAAARIEKETGLGKNAYILLKSLTLRQLVEKVMRDGKSYYYPGSPEKLMLIAHEKAESAIKHEQTIKQMLPELAARYHAAVSSPVVTHVQGITGIRDVYEKVYGQDIPASYGCLDLDAVNRLFPDYMTDSLIPSRIEHGSRAYALLVDSKETQKVVSKDNEQKRESVVVDGEKYPLPAEISVYGDYVVLLSFLKGDMVGLLIHHPDFAKSLESVYRRLFDLASENKVLLDVLKERSEKR